MSKAFTIIELLIALLIIGLLAGAITVGVRSSQAKARDSRRVNDLKLIQTAVKSYYLDTSNYPKVNQMGSAGTPRYARSYSAVNTWLDVLVSRAYITTPPTDPIDGQSARFVNSSGNSYTNRAEYTYVRYPPYPNSFKLITRLEQNSIAVRSDGGRSASCSSNLMFIRYNSTLIYEIGEGVDWAQMCP